MARLLSSFMRALARVACSCAASHSSAAVAALLSAVAVARSRSIRRRCDFSSAVRVASPLPPAPLEDAAEILELPSLPPVLLPSASRSCALPVAHDGAFLLVGAVAGSGAAAATPDEFLRRPLPPPSSSLLLLLSFDLRSVSR